MTGSKAWSLVAHKNNVGCGRSMAWKNLKSSAGHPVAASTFITHDLESLGKAVGRSMKTWQKVHDDAP
eukprot:6375854-Prorocentrum_lima.AAC.1